MKFKADKKILLNELKKLNGVIEKRVRTPILSHVLMQCAKDSIVLTGTDLETSKQIMLDALYTHEESGAFTVPIKPLIKFLTVMPDGVITFEVKEDEGSQWLIMTHGNIEFSVIGMQAEEYFSLPAFDIKTEVYSATIDSDKLLSIFNKLFYAISNEECRVNLNGLYIANEDGKTVFVATDGYRLAKCELDVLLVEKPILAPRKAIKELMATFKSFKKKTYPVTIQLDDRKFIVHANNERFAIETINETFPNYKQVLPKGNDFNIVVNRKKLIDSINRIISLSIEKYKGCVFSVRNECLEVSAPPIGAEYGKSKESIACTTNIKSPSFWIGLNATDIKDAITKMTSDNVTFLVKDEKTQVIVTDDSQACINVIMPMKI